MIKNFHKAIAKNKIYNAIGFTLAEYGSHATSNSVKSTKIIPVFTYIVCAKQKAISTDYPQSPKNRVNITTHFYQQKKATKPAPRTVPLLINSINHKKDTFSEKLDF